MGVKRIPEGQSWGRGSMAAQRLQGLGFKLDLSLFYSDDVTHLIAPEVAFELVGFLLDKPLESV